jgi:hypothetical protein
MTMLNSPVSEGKDGLLFVMDWFGYCFTWTLKLESLNLSKSFKQITDTRKKSSMSVFKDSNVNDAATKKKTNHDMSLFHNF